MAYSIGVSINNGTGNASITGLAITGTVLAYYVGKYIGAKIEQQDDEYYSVAKNRFQENYPLFTLDEKIGNIVITVVTNSADYISGDLQLGTKTLVKIGNGYIWLDKQTGGNLEEIYLNTQMNNILGIENNISLIQNIIWDDDIELPDYFYDSTYDLDFYDSNKNEQIKGIFYGQSKLFDIASNYIDKMKKEVPYEL